MTKHKPQFSENTFPLPRMARIEWPLELFKHVRLMPERFVLTHNVTEAIADAMAAEVVYKLSKSNKDQSTS